MRQESPHSFPSQPWTEHGFSMAKFLSIIQNPLPSQTPGLGMRPPGSTLQDSPHGFPLQVSATATWNIAVLNNRMAYVWKFTKCAYYIYMFLVQRRVLKNTWLNTFSRGIRKSRIMFAFQSWSTFPNGVSGWTKTSPTRLPELEVFRDFWRRNLHMKYKNYFFHMKLYISGIIK